MENNELKSKDRGNLISIGIEVGIIFILTALVLGALQYFKVLDMSVLFSVSKPTVEKKTETSNQNTKVKSKQSQSSAHSYKLMGNLYAMERNKALSSAYSIYEFEGLINTVDLKPGYDKETSSGYSMKIVFGVGDGSETITIIYPKEALPKIKVIENNKSISISDLKIGDKVSVETNLEILRRYPNNINSVIITKK